jgi:hypothetical protein
MIAVRWIQVLLAPQDTPPPLTFAAALEALYASHYTGRVILDFQDGRPRGLELPNPARLRLVTGPTVLDCSHT